MHSFIKRTLNETFEALSLNSQCVKHERQCKRRSSHQSPTVHYTTSFLKSQNISLPAWRILWKWGNMNFRWRLWGTKATFSEQEWESLPGGHHHHHGNIELLVVDKACLFVIDMSQFPSVYTACLQYLSSLCKQKAYGKTDTHLFIEKIK